MQHRHLLSNLKTRAQAAFRFTYLEPLAYLDIPPTAEDNECAAVVDADPWGPCFCPACNCKTHNHMWPALQVVS